MRQFIKKLSPRLEFAIVTAIAFGYIIFTSLLLLLSGVRRVNFTTGQVLRGIVVEVLILALVIAILRTRGWRLRRLGLQFSWGAAAAGIPLFIIYLLVYWVTATMVLIVYPAARTAWAFTATSNAPFAVMLLFIVVNSLFEELTVTAYVIGALEADGPGLAITASTLLRFSYHLYQGPLASLSVISLGLLFGTMFWRWRNLWPLMVAHTIANVVVFTLNPQRVN